MTPSALTLILVAAGCFAASAAASRIVLMGLTRAGILDRPNPRSSHKAPVPRGGGIGFILVLIVGLAVLALAEGTVPLVVVAGLALVAGISFADDLRSLPFAVRLAVHTAAVAAALIAMPGGEPILGDFLPVWLDRFIVGLAWLWFINLFNFMDGIDGIAAGEAIVIAVGLVGLALLQPALGDAALPAVLVAAAAAGFLIFNWHPARLFMGDVGSAGLGFVLGWLLIDLASRGFLAAALVLPMFFVLDASTTLLARFARGRPLATAHRDHAYQAGIDRGLGQRLVTGSVLALGVVLIALAWVSPKAPLFAAGAAIVFSGALIVWLRWGRQASRR